jgi:site-specific DNA-methyltransferase (adenine-specific)
MELMARYPDGYFDLAIVDPPYGIGNKFKGGKTGKMNFNEVVDKGWDIEPPNKDYFDELKRVSKNQIIWGGNYFLDNLNSSRCFIVWDKKVSEDFSLAMCELAWTSFDKLAKIYRMSVPKTGKKIHPTQKPIKLYEWLLMNYATCKTCKNQGGYYEDVAGDGGSQMWQVCDDCDTHERPVRILDTHLGSGSIAIACHNLGFELTACELDTDYYNEAIKRINEHKQQTRLF